MSLKILSIKKLGVRKTYNLTMRNDPHNYILANNLVSANSHGVAYSIISYRTAWLKTHYPKEFYTALLNNAITRSQENIVKYISSAKENEIAILPPDINRSKALFSLSRDGILFGLTAIKGIGEKEAEKIIANRPEDGYRSIDDLVKRGINQSNIKALAECGALEEITELGRKQVGEILPELVKYYDKLERWNEQARKYEENERAILEAISNAQKPPRRRPKLKEMPIKPEIKPDKNLSKSERLALERELLGFYLTGHPLDDYPDLYKFSKTTISDIKDGLLEDRSIVSVPAVISTITLKNTKAQKPMGILLLEDQTGRIEGAIFPKKWVDLKDIVKERTVNIIVGRVNKIESEDEDMPPIIKFSIEGIEEIEQRKDRRLFIVLKDGTSVEFLPDSTCTSWSQAVAYANNIIN